MNFAYLAAVICDNILNRCRARVVYILHKVHIVLNLKYNIGILKCCRELWPIELTETEVLDAPKVL